MESPHLYRRNAPPGLDGAVVERAIQLSEAQRSAGVAPVLTLKHLAVQADVPLRFLERVCARVIDPYQIHEVRKRDRVSKRVIAAPSHELRQVQRWILDNVFTRMPVSDHAFAYVGGRSAPESAKRHVGATWLIKLDVKDFFHEFDEAQVFEILRTVGYSALVSLELARIVTRHVSSPQPWLPQKYERSSPRTTAPVVDLLEEIFGEIPSEPEEYLSHPKGTRLGYLPQGAPTSGAISNVLSRGLDSDLANLALKSRMTFTRYADDIVMSSSRSFDRSCAEVVLREATSILRKHHLTPNRRKTRIVPAGNPLQVLGVRVDGQEARLSRRIRKKIEFHLRGIEEFGMVNHSDHVGFNDVLGFENYLYGLIRYAHDVQPESAAKYFARFSDRIPSNLSIRE